MIISDKINPSFVVLAFLRKKLFTQETIRYWICLMSTVKKKHQFFFMFGVILAHVKPQVLILHYKEIFNEYLIAVSVAGLNNQYLYNGVCVNSI